MRVPRFAESLHAEAAPRREDRPMSATSPSTPATVALDRAGVSYVPHVYEHQETATNFGEEAAAALGLREEQVFKTLVVAVDGALAVAIVPVANRLDLKAIAAAVGGKKATLADPALAERRTGYVVGGISPVGQRTALRTVLDTSAEAYPTIFVSGGRRGFDIELTPADLLAVTSGTTAAIAT
jgi:Cys-tRNA(Pro)/Cys-tRNA(Cys) deacylase